MITVLFCMLGLNIFLEAFIAKRKAAKVENNDFDSQLDGTEKRAEETPGWRRCQQWNAKPVGYSKSTIFPSEFIIHTATSV